MGSDTAVAAAVAVVPVKLTVDRYGMTLPLFLSLPDGLLQILLQMPSQSLLCFQFHLAFRLIDE
jgi:hypothetical protein